MGTDKQLHVLDIQRLSTEDGPGLRTTVFVKGCPLRCAWCHNPESISRRTQMLWVETHCIGCGQCVKACPEKILQLGETGQTRAHGCTACGACAEACPTGATEQKGRYWRAGDLCRELVKDRVYFDESGGGVTVSGGDPLMQPQAVAELLALLQAEGIQTAIDSALFADPEALETVLPHADLLLLDLKLADDAAHRRWAGVPNGPILQNARRVAQRMRQGQPPASLWLRTPIIPGATDSPANIAALACFIAEHLAGLYERWELCAFNNLCRDKYRRLGAEWPFAQTPLPRAADMEALLQVARTHIDRPERTSWTGATRLEEEAG